MATKTKLFKGVLVAGGHTTETEMGIGTLAPSTIRRRIPGHHLPLLALCTAVLVSRPQGLAANRPNILWLIAEDIGPDLACYGNPDARTPNLDRFASEGRLYRRAFSTAPVCSPSRSAFCTGMYQIAFDAQHHRSHRDDGHLLPPDIRLIADRLRDVGYFTANVVQLPPEAGFRGTGKTDWNFCYEGKPFDSNRWQDLAGHQPFYAQINFNETHRVYKKEKGNPTEPEKSRSRPICPMILWRAKTGRCITTR
ncbi:MAG TPA: sulfatase-like hydrolase/transferase [Verrucomicrobiae bacterium]|nr:sulfatase-like hydrolase/transferase [Verrucomicrobiae bacterium]